MAGAAAIARKVIIVTYLIVLHGAIVWLLLDKYVLASVFQENWSSNGVPAPSVEPLVTPTTVPSLSPTQSVDVPSPPVGVTRPTAPGTLIIPVAGVRPDQLQDTFSQARSEGRVHEAIDIPAAQMTPVLAAADGEIVRFHDSVPGGTTIYQISTDKRYFFYYAHLHSRAPGIAEGQQVTRGTIIGYVGDTGNAGAGNFHLHFAITAVVDPKRFWEGTSIDPYPILTGKAVLP